MKTTYPIIFGIWYGIWCTALHLLQSIDIFMDNAPAGAGRGRGSGAGAGEGATVQGASHRHRYLRQGQARARQTCQNSVNFSTKNKVKTTYRCIISMWKYILKYEYIDRGYSLFYCEAQARFRQGSARKGWPLR